MKIKVLQFLQSAVVFILTVPFFIIALAAGLVVNSIVHIGSAIEEGFTKGMEAF